MYSSLLLVVAMLLATATAMGGQNSVEYGKLPMVPPKQSNPTSALASRISDETSPPQSVSVINVTSTNTPQRRASQKGTTQGVGSSVATPNPSAVFILANGERLESNNYTLTHDSIQLMQNGVRRTFPMDAVNLQATLAANKQRGIDLKIPSNNSQMVLAF